MQTQVMYEAHPALRIETTQLEGGVELRLEGRCSTRTEAGLLVRAVEQVISQHKGALWMDCQGLNVLSRSGQEAILRIEHLASAGRVAVYWGGFTRPVVQQLFETGLYLLLRNVPTIGYRSIFA